MRPVAVLARGAVVAAFLLAPLVVIAEPASATPAPEPVCLAGTCTITIDQPGVYEWNPPAYLAHEVAQIDLYGASGGYSYAGAGGAGGRIKASIPLAVTTLNLVVGGKGSDCPACGGSGAGGFNGGGNGAGQFAAGGGGSTDVRANGGTVRFISAAGGGGAGGAEGATGGAGGGLDGADGGAAGGAGANAAGTTGSGRAEGSNAVLGGGGGAGFHGGGGAPAGSDGGGGGGASGAAPAANGVTMATGVNTGNGVIVLTYDVPDPSDYSVDLSVPPSPVLRGVPTTITATVTPVPPAGTVRFYASRDPDGQTAEVVCAAAPVDTSSGRATCDVEVLGPVRTYYAAQYVTPEIRASAPSSWEWMTAVGVSTSVGIRDVGAPPVAGTPITFTADVSPTDADGRVQFYVDDVELGAPVDVDAGVVTSPSTKLDVGTHRIRARFGSTATHDSSSTEIEVTAAAPEFPLPGDVPDADGELGGVPDEITVDEELELVATGYAPGAKVVFGVYSTPQQLASVTADASGKAVANVTVPQDLTEGTHTFVAAGSTTAGSARYLTAVTVLDAGAISAPLDPDDEGAGQGDDTDRAAPIDLADTGFRGLGVAGMAVLALVSGAFVLVVTRRRSVLA